MKSAPTAAVSGSARSPHPAACSLAQQAWFLVYTKPRQETIAVLNLQQQGFETYLPQYKKAVKARLSGKPTRAPSPRHAASGAYQPLQQTADLAGSPEVSPTASTVQAMGATAAEAGGDFEHLFPRYVFFRPRDASHSISSARSTRGVLNLVNFGGEAAQITDDLIGAIRLFEQQRAQTSPADISPFQPGKEVRLRHSALDGLTGLVKSVSSARVGVLIELLGRPQVVTVEHDQLELA